jgi:hypothetical protein
MEPNHRIALRAAARVCQQLALRRGLHGDVYLPSHTWARAEALLRQRDRARSLGWLHAAASLAGDLVYDLNLLYSQIERVIDAPQKQAHLQPLPSQSELYRDILALEQEFGEVEMDFKQGQMSVVTEQIVLGGIDLGAFEIRLDLDHLGETPCYRVIAVDPNPAASDSSVTHPHVQDGHLCEGDGHEAIQTALTEGRLVDFFLMVSRLLATYSQGRAYVELNRWLGLSCSDCGENVSERYAGSCCGCDAWLCDDCRNDCHGCQLGFCHDCLSICAGCGNACCGGCLANCQGCQAKLCNECLTDSLCVKCQKKRPRTRKARHASKPKTLDQPAAA